VLRVCAISGDGIEDVKRSIAGKLCAFAGHSGVGKSSILNKLMDADVARVSDLSERLARGRQTTRHVEIFDCAGGSIADTPGFSDVSMERLERIGKEDLFECFREFEEYFNKCRFSTCMHNREPGCVIKQAVEDGMVPNSRYQSYLAMLTELSVTKEWNSG